MLARCLPGILPSLSTDQALEVTQIYSAAGMMGSHGGLITRPPFRAPHHSTTRVGLIGGQSPPRPGEITLAHHGVLFMDELAEFPRAVLEVLRQPLEDRTITISRAGYSITFPAGFMLVAALNPCPCGLRGDGENRCNCSDLQVQAYHSRVSGPLLDRIDIHLEVPRLSTSQLMSMNPGEPSDLVKERVLRARAIQEERYCDIPGISCNAQISGPQLRRWCTLDSDSRAMLLQASRSLVLSARGHSRILRLARTMADLAGRETPSRQDLAEAISLRSLDRGLRG